MSALTIFVSVYIMTFYSDHSVVVCKLNCLKPPNGNLHSDKSSSDLLNSVQQLANTKGPACFG